MNQQTPAWRSRYEPAQPARPDDDAEAAGSDSAGVEPESRPAPDGRRDRVDFM
jgi:hypothetical protein